MLLVANGLLSPLPGSIRYGASGALVVAGILRELGLEPLPFPQVHRQIPRAVFEDGILIGALRFGFELGLGFRTYITNSSAYVLAGGMALLPISVATALAAAVGFGVGRAATAWVRYWSRRDEAWDETLRVTLTWFKPLGVPLVGAGLLLMSFAGKS